MSSRAMTSAFGGGLSDLDIWATVRGFLAHLERSGRAQPGGAVALSGDLHPMVPRVLRAVRQAVRDSGFRPIDCGRIPTAALVGFALSEGTPSVMVVPARSSGRGRAGDLGLRLFGPRGETVDPDLEPIAQAAGAIRAKARTDAPAVAAFDAQGSMGSGHGEDPEVDDRARRAFERRYLSFFGEGALTGLRVAVIEGAAVGGDILLSLLERLGAEVAGVGRSEGFVVPRRAPIERRREDLERLAEEAERRLTPSTALGDAPTGPVHPPILVATDGEGAHPFLAAVDPAAPAGGCRVVPISGDALGAMVCEDLDVDAVVVPATASDLVDRHLGHRGVQIVRTRAGARRIIEAMTAMEGGRKAAFDEAGGFLVETCIERRGRMLSPLPSPDGFLPILSVLAAAARQDREASEAKGRPALLERLDRLPRRFTTVRALPNVPRDVAAAALAAIRVEGLAEMWLLPREVRYREVGADPRSADPSLEAALRGVAERIERRFGSSIEAANLLERGAQKPSRLEHVSFIEGVRMTFTGGDVLHLWERPDGPELVLSATSDTEARARALRSVVLGRVGPVPLMIEAARAPSDLLA